MWPRGTVASNVNLSLLTRDVSCQGCIISSVVLIDGTAVATDATASNVDNVSVALANLSAGSHSLGLEMFTTGAQGGHFLAEFDNVLITGDLVTSATPLPAALPLFAASLGALGLLGWRRKRKGAAALAA
jgi:hypothetical protein